MASFDLWNLIPYRHLFIPSLILFRKINILCICRSWGFCVCDSQYRRSVVWPLIARVGLVVWPHRCQLRRCGLIPSLLVYEVWSDPITASASVIPNWRKPGLCFSIPVKEVWSDFDTLNVGGMPTVSVSITVSEVWFYPVTPSVGGVAILLVTHSVGGMIWSLHSHCRTGGLISSLPV